MKPKRTPATSLELYNAVIVEKQGMALQTAGNCMDAPPTLTITGEMAMAIIMQEEEHPDAVGCVEANSTWQGTAQQIQTTPTTIMK